MEKELTLPEKYGYRLLYTLLLAAIFLLCVGKYAGIDAPDGSHVTAALCIIGLFTVFSCLKAKGRIFCGLFVAALLLCLTLAVTPKVSVSFMQSYFHWFSGSGIWIVEWQAGYEIVQTVFISFIICIGEIFLEKYEKLRLVLSLSMLFLLLIAMFTKTDVSHAGVVCTFFYPVLVYLEWVQQTWRKHRNRNAKVHTLWIMPFLLVYLALMLLMPSPKEPYDWQFVKEAYRQIQSSISQLTDYVWGRGDDSMSPALSGFSEDARLFGGVSANTRKIMEIHGQVSLVTNIYLSGKTFDTFDGTQWQQTDGSAATVHFETIDSFLNTAICADTAKTLQAVEEYGPYSPRNYLSKTTLHITYTGYDTTMLFLPLKAEWVREKSDGYEVAYYQLNIDANHFYDLLATVQADTAMESFATRDLYTQQVVLSDKVQNYLDKITKDATNDIEKLRLIEQELSSFSYNRTPGALPDYVVDESSFLDYFLLESREGFCTHFATAFVLLARAEGIPARYVQGFCVPANGETKIPVYSNMAHAWPEVYIDGIGYIPFEPTPGYSSLRYTPWKITTGDAENSAGGTGAQYRPDVTMPAENEEHKETEDINAPSFMFFKTAAFVLPVIFGCALIIRILSKTLAKRRYRKMSLADKFFIEASVNYHLLALLGARRTAGETLEELSLQIRQLAEYDIRMTEFINLHEDILYGQRDVSPEMLASAQTVKKLLFDAIKRKSTLLYFFQKLYLYPYSA